ncbi:nitronate monooxygenase [Paraburkholderia sp. J76]|uniref:NAD(P)H-dependent flavin oxidoreductase n=1 Tax=Paraburkholderia sp. J76 TaxID=2805439 RepID=UPI002ABE5966|nr:nitronate monooxygenase [Paraburkholderia sp. J76]
MRHPTFPYSLSLPVFAAPMFLISGPELVVEACKAGIIGAFPTSNARPIEMLDQWMRRITEDLAAARAADPDKPVGPWAANVITHSSNQRLPEDLALIAKYKPPIVITALGSPKPVLDLVHAYGGLVFADVVSLKLARKAALAGADGLACVSAGAGGHTGGLSPFAFVAAVRKFFDGYVIVGGGIADGWGVAGAIGAGADLVYMGTRFIPTSESMAAQEYKQMLVDCDADDLLVSAAITGTPASWLRPSLVANGLDPDDMPPPPARNYDSTRSFAGKRWSQVWAAGQGVGSIAAMEPVSLVVERLINEYHSAVDRFEQFAADFTQSTENR